MEPATATGPSSPLSATPTDKLAEIHAAETRLSAPEAVLRLRVRSQMPPGDGARVGPGSAAFAGALGGAMGAAPRTSLGRARWALPDASELLRGDAGALPAAEESAARAAQREVAQRTLAAGTRALLYGSALAVVAAIAGARAAAQAYGIESEADMRRVCAEAAAPRAEAMKERLAPARAWFAARSATPGEGAAAVGDGEEGAFAAQLRRSGAFRGLLQRDAPPPPPPPT